MIRVIKNTVRGTCRRSMSLNDARFFFSAISRFYAVNQSAIANPDVVIRRLQRKEKESPNSGQVYHTERRCTIITSL